MDQQDLNVLASKHGFEIDPARFDRRSGKLRIEVVLYKECADQYFYSQATLSFQEKEEGGVQVSSGLYATRRMLDGGDATYESVEKAFEGIASQFAEFESKVPAFKAHGGYENRIRAMRSEAVTEAASLVKEMTANGAEIDFRLYYFPATGYDDGRIRLFPVGNEPAGFLQASDERFHGGIPYENYPVWVADRTSRLPILSTGGGLLLTHGGVLTGVQEGLYKIAGFATDYQEATESRAIDLAKDLGLHLEISDGGVTLANIERGVYAWFDGRVFDRRALPDFFRSYADKVLKGHFQAEINLDVQVEDRGRGNVSISSQAMRCSYPSSRESLAQEIRDLSRELADLYLAEGDESIIKVNRQVVDPAADQSFEPVYSNWRHGGWYVNNVRYPTGAIGCVSNNYPDGKWRIVCDDRRVNLNEPGDFTFASRDEAAKAEFALAKEATEAFAKANAKKSALPSM